MNETVKWVVGLGNPGAKYAATRHNAGARFVDLLAERAHGRFQSDARFQAQVASVELAGASLRLLKPATFMNVSGDSVGALVRFFKLDPAEVLIAHDDLDLPPGVVRLKRGGGHGGHNGLRDVIRHIGADFWRLRIGIGHPGHRDEVVDYVLRRAPDDEQRLVDEALLRAADALEHLLAHGAEHAMHRLHSSN